MSLRESLEKNRAITWGFVGLMFLATGGVLIYKFFSNPHEPGTSSKFYYYDMQTNELFADEADQISPIIAPSGGEGVQAQVYACGNGGETFIAMLSKYTPEGKKALEQELPPGPNAELIRRPGAESKWVPSDSPEGQQMRLDSAAAVRAFCKDKTPVIVFPPQ